MTLLRIFLCVYVASNVMTFQCHDKVGMLTFKYDSLFVKCLNVKNVLIAKNNLCHGTHNIGSNSDFKYSKLSHFEKSLYKFLIISKSNKLKLVLRKEEELCNADI